VTELWIALTIAALVMLVGVVWLLREARRVHRAKVAREKAEGNLKVKARMKNLAGKKFMASTKKTVQPAETMRGWVFIVVTKRRHQPPTEYVGWAATEKRARRALAAYLGQPQPPWWHLRWGRRRGERGASGGLLPWVVGLLLLAIFAPHIVDPILNIARDGLHAFGTWVRSRQ
jgi:hypothetical protein